MTYFTIKPMNDAGNICSHCLIQTCAAPAELNLTAIINMVLFV